MFLLGDSILNIFKISDGPETEAAKEAAGCRGKITGGSPKSLFVRHRTVEEESTQQCAEKGMTRQPTEFEGGFLEFQAMGGEGPGEEKCRR